MSYTKSQEAYQLRVNFGALAATATRTVGSTPTFPRGEITKIEILDVAAVTGDNTNRYSFSFNKGTVAVPVAITTLNLATGTDLTAGVPRTVTLPTGSAANDALRRIASTDVLHVVATKNGTAGNMTDFVVIYHVIPTYDYGNAAT